MKVLIREAAADDLTQIVAWIAEDNPSGTASVAARILDAIENRIVLFPNMGRPGRVAGTREWVVRGLPYIIVYTVDPVRDAVTILGVFHGAQAR